MSTFDNKSLDKVIIECTTTRQCSTSKTVSSSIYLTSTSIHNGTTSDNFRNTTHELYVPSIGNEWEDYEIKYG